MYINRKQILRSFLESIAEVADQAYQKKVWIEGRGPECDDFDEFLTYFFHEGIAIIQSYKDFGITDHQYKLLKEFHDKLDVFTDNEGTEYLPKEFIDHPKWKEIMGMAKEILRAFDYKEEIS